MTVDEPVAAKRRALPLPALAPAALVQAVPALLVLAVALLWAWKDGGYSVTSWLPGAIFLVALLVTITVARAVDFGSRTAAVAVGAFGVYVAWNYLTILWAQEPGPALEGSNRALLYFSVFAIVASRRWSASATTWLIGGYSLVVAAMIALALERATTSGDTERYFALGRLASPISYPNGLAALALLSFWPAVTLASRPTVPPLLRGVYLACGGMLLESALLAQSRATIVAVPVAAAVYLVIVPHRLRAAAALAAAGAATALSWGPVTAVYLAILNDHDPAGALTDARRAFARTLAALFFVGALWGFADRVVTVPARVVRAANAGAVVAVLALGGAAGAVAVHRYGSPVTRLEQGWSHFKSGRRDDFRRSHLLSGLGSNRYDLWRVAALEFERHPIAGIGSDNYAAAYVRNRRTSEEPIYPHSLELRLLSQTGLVGTALFVAFLVAAARLIWRVRRRGAPDASGASVMAAMMFAYFVIHGSVDWFWEIPALGTAAFAALALAVRTGADRRTVAAVEDQGADEGADEPGPARAPARGWTRPRVVLPAVLAAGALGIVALAGPWISARQVQLAVREWPKAPDRALDRLASARRLNPLSEEPDMIAGAIAGKLGRVAVERQAFERAVRRNPLNWYAHLELAIVASGQGRRHAALDHLAAAIRLDPGEPVLRSVRTRVRRGEHVDQAAVDQEFADRVAALQQASNS